MLEVREEAPGSKEARGLKILDREAFLFLSFMFYFVFCFVFVLFSSDVLICFVLGFADLSMEINFEDKVPFKFGGIGF